MLGCIGKLAIYFLLKFMVSKEIELEFDALVTSQKTFYDHTVNISKYTRWFVKELNKEYPSLNLSKTFLKHIELAALIYDIGKISIPLGILKNQTT